MMKKDGVILVTGYTPCSDIFNRKAESGRFTKKGVETELRRGDGNTYDLVAGSRKQLLGFSASVKRTIKADMPLEDALRAIHRWQRDMEADPDYEKAPFVPVFDDEQHYTDTAKDFDIDLSAPPKPPKKFGI